MNPGAMMDIFWFNLSHVSFPSRNAHRHVEDLDHANLELSLELVESLGGQLSREAPDTNLEFMGRICPFLVVFGPFQYGEALSPLKQLCIADHGKQLVNT